MIKIPQVSMQKASLILGLGGLFAQMKFIIATVVIFYTHKGLTIGDFFLIQGIFAIANIAFEIPTGYIGDLFSRKKVILLAGCAYTVGASIWFFFAGFWAIVLGEILWGLSSSLYSGTIEAYLYDVLKKENREQDAVKELSKIKTFATLGASISVLIGGIIYQHFGPDMAQLATLLVTGITPFLLFLLPDIPEVKRKVEQGKSKWKDIIDIAKYAIQHPELKWLMIYPATFGATTLILFWSLQPLMKLQEISFALFGVFLGINQIWRMLFAYTSNYMFRKLKTKKFALGLILLLIICSCIAILIPNSHNIYVTYIMLLAVGLAAGSQVALKVVTTSMINHRIKSDERATIISVGSMIGSVFTGSAMFAIKFLIDCMGIQQMLMIILPITLGLSLIALKNLLKLKL